MRRARLAVVAALTVGAAAATAAVAGLPDAEGSSETPAAMPPATAEVRRGTLIDTETHNGDLGYGDTTALAARQNGTLTSLAAAGSTVRRGKPLYRVDDDPVVLLYGRLPAYRTMSSGVTGADVKQFEKNLWALGYRGFTVDRTYSSATASAVRDWQDDLGRAETGRVEPDWIVYAAGAVRIDSLSGTAGDVVRPGADVLTTTGTSRVATVELEVADQRLAKVGASVQVTLPDGTDTKARITGAETVIEPGEGPEEDTTKVEVTVAFPAGRSPKGLDQASVDVQFTAAERKDVLTVPVAALLALAEGGYGVEVVDGATSRIAAVQTGLFADGQVEVSGSGIAEGMVVGVPA
jgi:peptidoglycan hydrolase-like protein with peptidoglycan-binding domain